MCSAVISPPPYGALAALAAMNGPRQTASQLLGLAPTLTPTVNQWIYVTQRFKNFLSNISLTDDQMADGRTKIKGVVKCLNKHYWGIDSDSENYVLGGSWGKQTRVRPPRDIDVIFYLPAEVYHRFQGRTGNIQSQLLQEVRGVVASTNSRTTIRSDGQVVVAAFNSFMVEIAPAFKLENGQAWLCDTNRDGRYKTIDPVAENKSFNDADKQWNRNARDLVRMLKAWQEYCNVPIKSFMLERLVVGFLIDWKYSGNDHFWYDWMVRDFFAHMLTRADGFIIMPGTSEIVWLGNEWLPKATKAARAAIDACKFEASNADALAATEWQKIFGFEIPRIT